MGGSDSYHCRSPGDLLDELSKAAICVVSVFNGKENRECRKSVIYLLNTAAYRQVDKKENVRKKNLFALIEKK